MGDRSGIQWTDATWNPVTGCTKISAGCKHCYAERDFRRPYPGRDFTDVRTHPDRLERPLRWKRPRRIFVNSMSDLFHEDVPLAFIATVFAVMALARQHTFIVLTKRPARMQAFLTERLVSELIAELVFQYEHDRSFDGKSEFDARDAHINLDAFWPLANVWVGVSVEDQEATAERIPLLLNTPARVRFLSMEPLLGPVDLTTIQHLKMIDWVIVGGESGPKARPCNVEWIRSIVCQCQAAQIPVFVKQLGARVSGQIEHPDNEGCGVHAVRLTDRKGGDPAEWPEDLRVREYPGEAAS